MQLSAWNRWQEVCRLGDVFVLTCSLASRLANAPVTMDPACRWLFRGSDQDNVDVAGHSACHSTSSLHVIENAIECLSMRVASGGVKIKGRAFPAIGHELFVAEAMTAFAQLAADMVLRAANGTPLLPRLLDRLLDLRRRGPRRAKSYESRLVSLLNSALRVDTAQGVRCFAANRADLPGNRA